MVGASSTRGMVEACILGNRTPRNKSMSWTSVWAASFSRTACLSFTLLRANQERWHDASQQGVWTENKGNYLFIDPVSYDKISAMGQKQGLRDDLTRHNYDLAGGVARLCLERKETVVKKVEGALKTFELIDANKSLARLSDKSMSTKSGDKFYPGLIVHICPSETYSLSDLAPQRLELNSPRCSRRRVSQTSRLS